MKGGLGHKIDLLQRGLLHLGGRTKISSPLYQQNMHRSVRNDDESAGKDGEANYIGPEGKGVEAKGREDGGSRDFNVEAVFVVDEGEVFDFVDNQAFEAVMEYRKLFPIRSVS